MPTTRETAADEVGHDVSPLEDLTQPLARHSKRTKRQHKKLEKKGASKSWAVFQPRGFLDLPLELLMGILELLRPSDTFALFQLNGQLRNFMLANEAIITRRIVNLRYPILERCLLPPVFMEDIDPATQELLRSTDRPDLALSHPNVHQNIPSPDNMRHCTCLTCIGRWNALCAAVDFAHWQDNLDKGEPIPTIPRGTLPPWNQKLLATTRRVVIKSLTSPLWHARILEAHLSSTTRSIRRHSQNKADQRPHFRMSEADARAGTDVFLKQEGPPTVEFPYSRDLYYMLEVFLPTRSWVATHQKWVYMSHTQEWHEMDLDMLVRMMAARWGLHQKPGTTGSYVQGGGNHIQTPVEGQDERSGSYRH
jgi:hypothetical protein